MQWGKAAMEERALLVGTDVVFDESIHGVVISRPTLFNNLSILPVDGHPDLLPCDRLTMLFQSAMHQGAIAFFILIGYTFDQFHRCPCFGRDRATY